MTPFERTCWFFNEIYLSIKPSPALKYFNKVKSVVQPGDVIAIRSHYFDRIVPGYWTHVGIYTGDVLGKEHQVIQTRFYGTYPIDLDLFLRAGWVAVLRPQLPVADREYAAHKAEKYIGRHYDLEFDFSKRRRLVCSKLIYLIYKEPLSLEIYPVQSFLGNKKAFLPDHVFMKGFEVVWISPGAKTPYSS
jgi:hypothetical protein